MITKLKLIVAGITFVLALAGVFTVKRVVNDFFNRNQTSHQEEVALADKDEYVEEASAEDDEPEAIEVEDKESVRDDDSNEGSSSSIIIEDEEEVHDYSEAPISTSLSYLSPFQGELHETLTNAYGESVDNTGSSSNYVGRIRKWGGSKDELHNYATYILGGQYKKLVFDAALAQECKDAEKEVYLQIFGDGEKLFETTHFRSGVRPESYEVNVENVDELTIRIEGATYFSLMDGDISNTIVVSEMSLLA